MLFVFPNHVVCPYIFHESPDLYSTRGRPRHNAQSLERLGIDAQHAASMLVSEALGLELSVKFHVTPVSQDEAEGLEDPPVILSDAEPLLGQTLLAIYNQSKMLPVYNCAWFLLVPIEVGRGLNVWRCEVW